MQGRQDTTLIGSSQGMRLLNDAIRRIAPSSTPVLVLGENGTGKELVARAIHGGSPRAHGPFVAVNCGALPDTLLAALLFGHEEGAFTGANGAKTGLVEAARGGTLFLDEVGDVSPGMQIQLLRFLDDGWFTPVGSTTPRHSNVRILAATHRDISRHVAAGLFREDFAYRLAVLVVEIPPLRERLEDIPELVAGFLVEQALRTGKVKRAGSRLLTSLMANPWPGNVRQLRSEIERLCVLSGEETELDPADYVPRLGPTACARMQPIPPGGIAPLVDDYARRLVLGAIARHPINVTAAARECGYSLQGFKGLCVRLGIPLALAGRSGARRARTLTHRGNSHPTFTSLVRSPAP